MAKPDPFYTETSFLWCGFSFPESLLTCKPKQINYGHYEPVKSTYLLNDRIKVVCAPDYYLYGVQNVKCSSLPGDEVADWLPVGCQDSSWAGCLYTLTSECLTPAMYDEKCRERGLRVTIDNNRPQTRMSCASSEGKLHLD